MKDTKDLYDYGFFARHETFCPRYGWLKKGFDGVEGYNGVKKEPKIFDADDAIEKLGVGKNMVRSIRFWCLAFKVIEHSEAQEKFRIGGELKGSEFGKALLSTNNGWDPYLEDIGSLWLLHWQLFIPPIVAPAWSIAMNIGDIGIFTIKELGHVINEHRGRIDSLKRYSDSSIEKDASCLTRMYAPPTKSNSDEIECPFTCIELLLPSERKQTYRFNLENKSSLPDDVLMASCFSYAHFFHPHSKTISLNKLAYGQNSPGVVFKLSESEIGNRIEKVVNKIGDADFIESYGSRQLQFEQTPIDLYWATLKDYYE